MENNNYQPNKKGIVEGTGVFCAVCDLELSWADKNRYKDLCGVHWREQNPEEE